MEYTECGSACNATCAGTPICIEVCVPRCECPAEIPIWHDHLDACGTTEECPEPTVNEPPAIPAPIHPPTPPALPPPPLPPPSPPSPPPPLLPGEQLGALNVSITERFVTVSVEIDSVAIDDRLQQYVNTITEILGEALAVLTTVTVRVGFKIFTNTSDVVVTPVNGTRRLSDDVCNQAHTEVITRIELQTPVPESQLASLLASLPDSVYNGINATIYRCGPTEIQLDEIQRIPAPSTPPRPPPPPSSPVAWQAPPLWAVLLALLIAYGFAFCCCTICGCIAARGRNEEDDRYDRYGRRSNPAGIGASTRGAVGQYQRFPVAPQRRPAPVFATRKQAFFTDINFDAVAQR